MAGMTDAEVFGIQPQKPPAAGMTDAEVFGKPTAAPPPEPEREQPTLAGALPTEAPAPASFKPSPGFDPTAAIRHALAPAPNTTYGNVLPLAKDNATGEIRLALPGMLRAPLLGLTQEGGQATINPDTGTLGITPEAASVAGFAASPLRIGPMGPVPAGLAAREAPLSPAFRDNALTPAAANKVDALNAGAPVSAVPAVNFAPSPTSRNLPPASVSAPVGPDGIWLKGLSRDVQEVLQENGRTSLGAAATPEEVAVMSPAQMKANRRMAELGEILAPPEAGESNTIIVAGSEPTLAERAGEPLLSQRETVLRQRKPDQFDPRLSANSQARVNQFDTMAGTDPQLATLNEMQAKAAQTDTARIMRSLKPADGQPLLEYYDNLLNDPRIAERGDVVAALKPLRAALFDADGNLKTDAMSYWGMHDNLMAKLAKAKDPLNATGAEKYAFEQLLGAKKATDAVMNGASDGAFQTFLDNQAGFFQQKNAMEVLQKFRTKLVNPKTGHIYADAYHRWVVDLGVRRGKPGVDAAMDIPDDVMRGLIDIDTDLKRASRIDLGKARGSPTNLFFEVAKAAGIVSAHGLAAATTGGVGNFVMQQGGQTIANWRLNRLTDRHLAPPPGGYTPKSNGLTP